MNSGWLFSKFLKFSNLSALWQCRALFCLLNMLLPVHVHKKTVWVFVLHFDNMAFQKESNSSHAHQIEKPYGKQAITWTLSFSGKCQTLETEVYNRHNKLFATLSTVWLSPRMTIFSWVSKDGMSLNYWHVWCY